MKLAILGLFMLSGCVSREIIPSRQVLSVDDFLRDQKTRWETFRQLAGKVRIEVMGVQALSGSGKLVAEPFRKKAFFEITDILGRPHLNVIVNAKKAFVLYPRERRGFEDHEGGLLYLSRVGIPVPFLELVMLSFGGIPDHWKIKRSSWSAAEDAYELTADVGEQSIRIRVDPLTGAVNGIIRKGYRIDYGEFEQGENGLWFALWLRVTTKDRELKLEWEDGPHGGDLVSDAAFSLPLGYTFEYIRRY